MDIFLVDIFALLRKMAEFQAVDLYLTEGLPPTWRGNNLKKESDRPLSQTDIQRLMMQVTTEEDRQKFATNKELNIAISDQEGSRYRANFFYQQGNIGIVIRKMQDKIPTIEDLGLKQIYKDAIMETRGLILVVGMSGSGKSTSIASMLDYRNHMGGGHVITIEDPIEYIHKHKNCIFTQREVGLDTHSWNDALKSALRQRPDIIYIGEIRDAETMAHAINFAETGHLCIATLHATSASQAIERVSNFFPLDTKYSNISLAHIIRYRLAHVLRYIFAQRLVKMKTSDDKIPAIEILRNEGFIKPLIMEGKIPEIRDMLGKHADIGMMNFEQSLLDHLGKNLISEETAISESDNPDNMRLNIMKINAKKATKYGETSF